jgi:phage shock protein E
MRGCGFHALLLGALFGFGGYYLIAAEPSKAPESVPVSELPTVLKHIADKKAVLVDVRTPSERKEYRLEGSIHLPLAEIKQAAADPAQLKAYLAKHLPQDKIIYVHCQAGLRAKQACLVAANSGFDLRTLKADYDELLEAGFKPAK